MTDPDEIAAKVAATGAAAATNGQLLASTSRSARIIAAIAAAVVVATVVAASVINIVQQNAARSRIARTQQTMLTILRVVEDATNPASGLSKANAARGQRTVIALIGCIENHSDRNAAKLAHLPPPPVRAGCPT